MLSYRTRRLAVMALVLACASGCSVLSGSGKINGPVADPPDIPGLGTAMPGSVAASDNPLVSTPDELPSFEMFNYKDIDALGNDTAFHRLLKKAVDYAIEENILRKPMAAGHSADALLAQKAQQASNQNPAPAPDTSAPEAPIFFKPNDPVTYGDFFKWYERFRDAVKQEKNGTAATPDQAAPAAASTATPVTAAAAAKPDQKTTPTKPAAMAPAKAVDQKSAAAPKSMKATGVDVNAPVDTTAANADQAGAPTPAATPAPAAPAPPDLGPLSATLSVGGETLTSKTVLTRQQLCALFALIDADLKGEHGTESLDAMTPEEWQGLKPEGATGGQTLADFHDYAGLDGALKKYVGQAYRDGMLETVFGLAPETLTEDAGLGPQKTVSRAQALVMVFWAMKGR